MIARLRGRIVEVGDDTCVVDVGGVGYLVHGSPRLLRRLAPGAESVDLVIETLVREDAITLVGFATAAERRLFKLLQGIQGVGSRLALAILGVLDPEAFAAAVATGDRAALTRAPGVGPKLAQRILAELKDRIGLATEAPVAAAGVAAATGDPLDDAVTALAQLGYGRSEAHAAARAALAEIGADAELPLILRQALQRLGKQQRV